MTLVESSSFGVINSLNSTSLAHAHYVMSLSGTNSCSVMRQQEPLCHRVKPDLCYLMIQRLRDVGVAKSTSLPADYRFSDAQTKPTERYNYASLRNRHCK